MWVKISRSQPESLCYLRHSAQPCTVHYRSTVKSLKHSEDSSSIKTNWIKVTKKDSIKHWGTRGMKWGHRRYQNSDGSLTPLGEIHYGVGTKRERRKAEKEYVKTKEAEDKAYIKQMKATQKFERDQKKAEDKQAKEEERAKNRRERRVKRDIEKEEKAAKKAEEKEREAEEERKLKEKMLADKDKEDDSKQEESKKDESSENNSSPNEKKAPSSKGSENKSEKKNQNESSKAAADESKPRKPFSAKDYTDVETAFSKGSQNFERNANLVDIIDRQRRSNKVAKAIGKRELSKPISEMTNKEIDDTINRWTKEENLARMTVGQKSQAAENVQTALRVLGNVVATAGGAAGIASAVRSIYERR